MSKIIKNKGSTWTGDDPNEWKKFVIEISLENYKITKDPICLAQIISCLDFHGNDEAKDILTQYLSVKTRRTRKYTDQLLWKHICDTYFRLKKQEAWQTASHEALANYIYHDLGDVPKSENDEAFATTLAKQLKNYS